MSDKPVEPQRTPTDSPTVDSQKSGRFNRIISFSLRVIKWTGILSAIATLITFSTLTYLYNKHVVWEPAPHIEPDAIQRIISQESPIYYRNSTQKIGSLFDSKHRIYVPESELPEDWIAAITAAEDQRYFTHGGLDYKGIVRALIQNFQAGRVVSGGSTLTQQTAKNLYYRRDRSLKAKLNEAVNAFRLERRYSKGQILEFYSNQFHVNANGRGLGIAARYFFDKKVSELTTLECAYIAGMVKGPRNYNPFIGKSRERRDIALSKAHTRTQYVLDRMLDTGAVNAEKYRELSEIVTQKKIPFQKGQFQYDSNLLADEVARRLQEEPFKSIFDKAQIDNPSTAGLKITTTIDYQTQRAAHYGVLHHLSEIGPLLEEPPLSAWFEADGALRKLPFSNEEEPLPKTFHYGRLIEIVQSELVYDLNGAQCRVDKAGMQRLATIVASAEKGRRRKGKIASVLEAAEVGSMSWLSVRQPGICDLEIKTKLQGAVLAAQEGQILAMVGGRENRDYNRAIESKRQLGSVWKTLVYAAALQLGWTPTDMLDNDHNAFPFENFWYYPRAAHRAPRSITMAWAGVHSENRASVWLLYHLTDRLSVDELLELAKTVGLGPLPNESRKDYIQRIRDKYGVISTHKRDEEIAFMRAKREIVDGLEVGDESLALRSLLYGRGASRQIRKAKNSHNKRVAAFNLLNLRQRSKRCMDAHAELQTYYEMKMPLEPLSIGLGLDLTEALNPIEVVDVPPPSNKTISLFWRQGDSIGCGQNQGDSVEKLQVEDLIQWTTAPPLLIDGVFQVETLLSLERAMERHKSTYGLIDPYSLPYLIHHPDFQFILNVQYLAQLIRQFGVDGDIPPRQSLPLGAKELSLAEAAMLYGGILSGKWISEDAQNGRQLQLIDKIVYTQHAEDGQEPEEIVLYQRESRMEPVSGVEVGWMTADILRNVVEHGTAKRARGKVHIGDAMVPILGKTGTTNSFRNAAFCGIAPAYVDGAWSLNKGMTIASYVGYDDNQKMMRKRIRIAGASGALPLWIHTAQGAADSGLLGLPSEDASWTPPIDLHRVSVHSKTGEPVPNGKASVWFYSQSDIWGGDPTPQRLYTPVRPNVEPNIHLLKPNVSIEEDTGGAVRIMPIVDSIEEDPPLLPSDEPFEEKPPHRIIPDRLRGDSDDNGLQEDGEPLLDAR